MSSSPTDDTAEGPTRRRPKMAEIARLAGVDMSTVSRALAGSPRVAKETRERIDQIVRETGYVVNERARNLNGHSKQVLAIVSDIAAPFYSDVVQGIVEALAKRGINVLLGATLRQAKREAELGKQMLTGVVDGIITVTGSVPKTVLDIQGVSGKVVAISRPVAHEGVTCVTIDNYAAAREVMVHLHGMGHRRIVHISGPRYSETYRDRIAAYVDFMNESGLKEYAHVVATDSFKDDAQSGFDLMRNMLGEGQQPTAVFCATDELAIGAMAAARQGDKNIPSDISFFGFDDLKLASLMHPPLSTVSVPRFEMGRAGAEALYKQIYEGTAPSARIVLKHRLVLRNSVARLAQPEV